MMKTATMGAAAPKTIDLRSSSAIAIDESTEYLCERVPHRVPPGAHHLLLATPSWTSAAASEYARLLRAELVRPGTKYIVDTAGFKHPLEDLLDELPRALLKYNPSLSELRELRAKIDAAVDELRNPPMIEPLPMSWRWLAAELGVTLPKAERPGDERRVRDSAEVLLQGELEARTRGDRVLEPIMLVLRRRILAAEQPSLEERRARYVLAAEAKLPSVADESEYHTPEAELRELVTAPAAPTASVSAYTVGQRRLAHVAARRLPGWYVDLSRRLGAPAPLLPDPVEYTAEHEKLAAKHRAGAWIPKPKPAAERTAGDETGQDVNDREFRAAAAELDRAQLATVQVSAAAWTRELADQRAQLLAAFDSALAKLPIGATWWWTLRVRDAVAKMADAVAPEVIETMFARRPPLEHR